MVGCFMGEANRDGGNIHDTQLWKGMITAYAGLGHGTQYTIGHGNGLGLKRRFIGFECLIVRGGLLGMCRLRSDDGRV